MHQNASPGASGFLPVSNTGVCMQARSMSAKVVYGTAACKKQRNALLPSSPLFSQPHKQRKGDDECTATTRAHPDSNGCRTSSAR